MSISKKAIHAACLTSIRIKKEGQEKLIKEAQEAAAGDTKSSAGDKYETAREMIKQEIDKANHQLAIYERMEEALMKIDPNQSLQSVAPGSLIQTNEGTYFFSVSLGRVKAEKADVYVLSMASPLGKAMKGMTKGQELEMRGRKIEILDIS